MNRWCVIVTGSRRAVEKLHGQIVHDVLKQYMGADQVIVLHGDAPGIDTIARRVVRALGFPFQALGVQYFPDGRDGVSGGQLRNRCMVDVGVVLRSYGYKLIAHGFPDADSVGTWGCLAYARRNDVKAEEHRL